MSARSSTGPTVGAAAARLLKARLALVERRLRAAADAPDKPKAIHQLRVATRRARAAVEFFQPALAKRSSRWLLKQLRKLRKAVDDARNLDVYRKRMSESEAPEHVLGAVDRRRKDSSAPLEPLAERLVEGKRWQQHQQTLLKKLRASPKHADALALSLAEFAPQRLAPLAADFVSALHAKAASSLHALRVAGKQLRYTLELLEEALPQRRRAALIARLEKLQETLGQLNDHTTAAKLLDELAADAKHRAERKWFSAAADQERATAQQMRAKFLRQFTAKRRKQWEGWVRNI